MVNNESYGNVRLIVTDLDGTLLTSRHTLSPFTQSAVEAALAQGILFTVATGKTFPSTTGLIEQFGITTPVICANGTLIHAPDGSPLHEDPIARELALEAVRLGLDHGMTPVVYVGFGLLSPVWDANVDEVVAHHEPSPAIEPDIIAALSSDYKPYKLLLMNQDPAKVERFQRLLEERFAGRTLVLRTGLASVVEVSPLGVTKGTALARILADLDIPPAQVIAFGDNCNDLDMIRLSGIGVAMGHGPHALRAAADYVTATNDEDGVGLALHKFVLHPHSDSVKGQYS